MTKSTNNCNLFFWTRKGEKQINNLYENITTTEEYFWFIEFMGLKCTGGGRKKYKNNNLLPLTYYLCRLQKYFMNNISSAG